MWLYRTAHATISRRIDRISILLAPVHVGTTVDEFSDLNLFYTRSNTTKQYDIQSRVWLVTEKQPAWTPLYIKNGTGNYAMKHTFKISLSTCIV